MLCRWASETVDYQLEAYKGRGSKGQGPINTRKSAFASTDEKIGLSTAIYYQQLNVIDN